MFQIVVLTLTNCFLPLKFTPPPPLLPPSGLSQTCVRSSPLLLVLFFSKMMIKCQEIGSILPNSVLHNSENGCIYHVENSQWGCGWETGKGGQISPHSWRAENICSFILNGKSGSPQHDKPISGYNWVFNIQKK